MQGEEITAVAKEAHESEASVPQNGSEQAVRAGTNPDFSGQGCAANTVPALDPPEQSARGDTGPCQSQEGEDPLTNASGNGSQPVLGTEVSLEENELPPRERVIDVVPGRGSKSAQPDGPGSKVEEQRGPTEAIVRLKAPQRPKRRATGPRTELGKRRASLNATKHGIFSRASVLKGESRAEYESLLKGLQESFHPVGSMEEIFVEKLATILWRHGRLITAEAAEIRKRTDFLEEDRQNRQQQESEELRNSSTLKYDGGLIRKIQNPVVLGWCLELLAALRESIEDYGFEPKLDIPILEKIYGEFEKDQVGGTLYDAYIFQVHISNIRVEGDQPEEYPLSESCRQNFLRKLNAEIRRLKRYGRTRNSIEADQMKIERVRRSIPDSPDLDRLLRYEAHLSREFDRTLSQLERLQRMRLGQPVPPPIKVNLSS